MIYELCTSPVSRSLTRISSGRPHSDGTKRCKPVQSPITRPLRVKLLRTPPPRGSLSVGDGNIPISGCGALSSLACGSAHRGRSGFCGRDIRVGRQRNLPSGPRNLAMDMITTRPCRRRTEHCGQASVRPRNRLWVLGLFARPEWRPSRRPPSVAAMVGPPPKACDRDSSGVHKSPRGYPV